MAEQGTSEGGGALKASPSKPSKTGITLTFWRDDESNEIRTCIHQDYPDYRGSGDCDLLTDAEFLELLGIVGSSEGKAFLDRIRKMKPLRRRFDLATEQAARIREKFFSADW